MGRERSVKSSPTSRLPGSRKEVAAVCYRMRKGGIEFLLVQTRGGRWIFPKGGVEPGLTDAQSAALEAFEEAGVHGRMEAISFARYFKRREPASAAKDVRAGFERGEPVSGSPVRSVQARAVAGIESKPHLVYGGKNETKAAQRPCTRVRRRAGSRGRTRVVADSAAEGAPVTSPIAGTATDCKKSDLNFMKTGPRTTISGRPCSRATFSAIRAHLGNPPARSAFEQRGEFYYGNSPQHHSD